MEGFVPKDRPSYPNRVLGDPPPQPRDKASAHGDRKAQKLGDLAQMPESVARRFVVSPQKINVEDVLPGPSSHRA